VKGAQDITIQGINQRVLKSIQGIVPKSGRNEITQSLLQLLRELGTWKRHLSQSKEEMMRCLMSSEWKKKGQRMNFLRRMLQERELSRR